jgi:hypothetical protein
MLSTHDANRIAVGHCAKAVRLALLKLGMLRCSLQLVYRQCEAESLRPSWYCLCVRWFAALFMANREGAEFLFEDFRARFEALRARAAPPPAPGWFDQLARCERAHSEAVCAALSGDESAVRARVADDIREKRSLLAALERRPRANAVRAA